MHPNKRIRKKWMKHWLEHNAYFRRPNTTEESKWFEATYEDAKKHWCEIYEWKQHKRGSK